jgi:hypothetical protein
VDESGTDRNEPPSKPDVESLRNALKRKNAMPPWRQDRGTYIEVTVRLWDQDLCLGVEEGAAWRREVAVLIGELVHDDIERLDITDLRDAEVNYEPVRIASVERRIQILAE